MANWEGYLEKENEEKVLTQLRPKEQALFPDFLASAIQMESKPTQI